MTRITTLDEYYREYQSALENPEDFWGKQAQEFLWKKPWEKVLSGDFM